MSLRAYRRQRLVALNPRTPVFEAARAIEQNNIGAVVIVERGSVEGIVTDRDLAIRVLARGLDPSTTPVRDVMTSPVTTLSPSHHQSDAVRVMEERNVRRIPLVENGRLAGMVTLDDLLLDEAAAPDQLARIVYAQIGEGGPAPPPRAPSMLRRAARAESTYRRFLNRVQAETRLEITEQVDLALEIVLTSLVRRLTPGEAKDLISQLPSLLHPTLFGLPPGPDKLVTRDSIVAELSRGIQVDEKRAEEVLRAVGSVIAQSVSEGQMEDVRRQLPEELRRFFAAPPATRTASPGSAWPEV